MNLSIPIEPAQLTADWLTSALRSSGTIRPDATVSTVNVTPLGADKGFFSNLSRLAVCYERLDGDAPGSIIAKLSATSAEIRQRPNTIAAYEREVRFYQHHADQTSLPVPACYYADIDTSTGYHVLLLEDLAPAQNGSREAGCAPEQAELAVTRIAEFHAHWWENSQLAELDWIPDPTFDRDELVESHAGWWPEFLRQAGHNYPDALIALGERFGPSSRRSFSSNSGAPRRER